jgi:hypothetical protein
LQEAFGNQQLANSPVQNPAVLAEKPGSDGKYFALFFAFSRISSVANRSL